MSSETLRNMLVKQEPVSCCYVCAATRADYSIFSKPCDDRPFFPFLEHHNPPDGAESLTSNGKAYVCSLCYAFLNQQWDSYERSKTSHNKRIYWLKRLDNGPFAGMEINLQHDYESLFDSDQGSSEHELRIKPKHKGNLLPEIKKDKMFHDRSESRDSMTSNYHTHCESSEADSNALDLSLPARSPFQNDTEVCYICGNKARTFCNIFAKPISNCPFFPTLLFHAKLALALPMDEIGKVRSCDNCHKHLLQQWDFYQQQNVPHTERCYQLNKIVASPNVVKEIHVAKKTFVCFTCGMVAQMSIQRMLNTVPEKDGDPYFSFLSNLCPSPGANPASNGKVVVCSLCYKSLFRQLKVFEMSGIPEGRRKYKVHNDTSSEDYSVLRHHLKSGSNTSNVNASHSCYLCEKMSDCLSLVSTIATNDMYFPFIRNLPKPANAELMNGDGCVRACKDCLASLKFQWDAFEHAKIPINQRQYKIMNPKFEHSNSSSFVSKPVEIKNHIPKSLSQQSRNCCLCNTNLVKENTHVLETMPKNDAMSFPFIRAYMRPENHAQIDQFGRVHVCNLCHSLLKNQWELFELANVPHSQRHYRVLPPLMDKERKVDVSKNLQVPNSDSTLRVQVSSPDIKVNLSKYATVNEPLLTTVNTLLVPNVVTSSAHTSYSPRTSNMKSIVRDFGENREINDTMVNRLPCPLDVPLGRPILLNTFCFVCGEYSSTPHMYALYAKPTGIENMPFFPFLNKHPLPEGAQRLAEDGSCLACMFCYHSLLSQYVAYETSPYSEDTNPWQRKYNMYNFVCYICGVTTYRKRVCSIAVQDFPFLFEHQRPLGALTLLGGECVVTCLTCFDSLTSQWKDFERMKVPVAMRKYNWMVMPVPQNDENNRGCHILNEDCRDTAENERSNDSEARGVAHPNKPPTHLQLHSIYGPKPGTVEPPFHLSTPHSNASFSPFETNEAKAASVNANRTSSFAAALRKLAKQAVDPITERVCDSYSESSSLGKHSLVGKQVAGPPPFIQRVRSPLPNSHLSGPDFMQNPNSRHIERQEQYSTYNSVATSNSSSSKVPESIAFKVDYSKPVNSHNELRNDNHMERKPSPMSPFNRFRSSHEEHRLRSLGFQPYKDSDHPGSPSNPYNSSPPPSGYPYHPSLYPGSNLSQQYRLEEPTILDRHGLQHPSGMPLHPSSRMLPYSSLPFYTSGNYPPELISHETLQKHSPFNAERSRGEIAKSNERNIEESQEHVYRGRRKDYLENHSNSESRDSNHSRLHSPIPYHASNLLPSPNKSYNPNGQLTRASSPPASSLPLNLVKNSSSSGSSHHEELVAWKSKSLHTSNGRHDEIPIGLNRAIDGKLMPPALTSEVRMDSDLKKIHVANTPSESFPSYHKLLVRSNRRDLCPSPDNNSYYTEQRSHVQQADLYNHPNSSNEFRYNRVAYKELPRPIASSSWNKVSMEVKSEALPSREAWSPVFHSEGSNRFERKDKENLPSASTMYSNKSSAPEFIGHAPTDNTEPSITRALLQNNITPSIIEKYTSHEEILSYGVSKLDLREQKIRKIRQVKGQEDCELSDSESDDSVDLRLRERLVLTKGPPLKFDKNQHKIEFLKVVGLTTHIRKHALEWRKYMKRRQIHRDDYSYVDVEKDTKILDFDEEHIAELSKRLHLDTSEGKIQYFNILELKKRESQTPKVKKEVIEDSSQKRHETEEVPKCQTFVEAHFKKRLLNGMASEKKSQINGNNMAADNLHGQMKGNLHLTHASTPPAPPSLIPKEQSKRMQQSLNGKTVISSHDPRSRFLNKSFAQEFHESVLHTTQKQLGEKTPDSTSPSGQQSENSILSEEMSIFKWPGIEAIMESYETHLSEQNCEKDFLYERCKNLQSTNQELNCQIEELGQKTRELLQKKHYLDSKRQSFQAAMDNLNEFVHAFR